MSDHDHPVDVRSIVIGPRKGPTAEQVKRQAEATVANLDFSALASDPVAVEAAWAALKADIADALIRGDREQEEAIVDTHRPIIEAAIRDTAPALDADAELGRWLVWFIEANPNAEASDIGAAIREHVREATVREYAALSESRS